MITIIDTTTYAHCSPRNYKQIPVEDVIPKEPCLTYSRYEVLQQKIRKVYFDFDGIPNDNAMLIVSFIDDYNMYIVSKKYVKEPIEFVYTVNSESPNHPGVGSHIIQSFTYESNQLAEPERVYTPSLPTENEIPAS